jgi:4-hydroxy-4-methyl-2-oxoglutarate aldolase
VANVSTAACADACVQLGVPLRAMPLLPVRREWRVEGPARPVLHAGSVDIFLEACESLHKGDVLIVDDGGRTDRACVGDLTALEVQGAGGAGIVVWGCHRDTGQLLDVDLPVFSLGARPNGPASVEDRGGPPRLGEHPVEEGDVVVGDADGIVLVPAARVEEIMTTATEIVATETGQADAARKGRSLREQLDFAGYLAERSRDPSFTLREHLRRRGGAIER